jgi:hypothetical protein
MTPRVRLAKRSGLRSSKACRHSAPHGDRRNWKELSLPFYGYNRPGAKVSEGVRESFWLQGMMAGFPAAYFCIKAFSETDQTEDLKKFDIPMLIMQGDGSKLRSRSVEHVCQEFRNAARDDRCGD